MHTDKPVRIRWSGDINKAKEMMPSQIKKALFNTNELYPDKAIAYHTMRDKFNGSVINVTKLPGEYIVNAFWPTVSKKEQKESISTTVKYMVVCAADYNGTDYSTGMTRRIDPNTGDTVWETKYYPAYGYSSPPDVTATDCCVNGQSAFTAMKIRDYDWGRNFLRVEAREIGTGDLKWEYMETPPTSYAGTLKAGYTIRCNDTHVVITGVSSDAGLLGTDFVMCFDAATGTKLWEDVTGLDYNIYNDSLCLTPGGYAFKVGYNLIHTTSPSNYYLSGYIYKYNIKTGDKELFSNEAFNGHHFISYDETKNTIIFDTTKGYLTPGYTYGITSSPVNAYAPTEITTSESAFVTCRNGFVAASDYVSTIDIRKTSDFSLVNSLSTGSQYLTGMTFIDNNLAYITRTIGTMNLVLDNKFSLNDNGNNIDWYGIGYYEKTTEVEI